MFDLRSRKLLMGVHKFSSNEFFMKGLLLDTSL